MSTHFPNDICPVCRAKVTELASPGSRKKSWCKVCDKAYTAFRLAANRYGLPMPTTERFRKARYAKPGNWSPADVLNFVQDSPAKKASPGRSSKKQRNWNGMSQAQRIRELRRQQREQRRGSYLELSKLSGEIAKLVSVLTSYQVQDFGKDEASLMEMTFLMDDLITLGQWLDIQTSATMTYLSDFKVLEKIQKLRDTTGRTEEEADTARKLADRLERKMNNRLSA